MTLKQILNERLSQLGYRKISYEVVIKSPKSFVGKKVTKEDLIKVDYEIKETEAAIKGIHKWVNENNFKKITDADKSKRRSK